jgi:hypothetical protein
MEIIWGILYLVIIAFLITLFFRFLLQTTGPWGSFWAFFTIILLAVIAANVWISPIGPYFFENIFWAPPLAVGLLIALLLAATTPSPVMRSKTEAEKEHAGQEAAAVALGTFFWFLIIFLIIIILAGLFISPGAVT